MNELAGAPAGIDPRVPSPARAYDYALFGKDHYANDREFLHGVLERMPDAVWAARENRAYLGRVVRFLAESCGIRQFIDHGSGLPTQDNVHQVAQRHRPGSRVVYTDNDPTVLAHGRALLAEDASTTVVQADMTDPEAVLGDPAVRELIDFGQPVALLYLSVLHFVSDAEDPRGIVGRMLGAVPSGSYLAISHITTGNPRIMEEMDRLAGESMRFGRVRWPKEIHRFFDGLEVVEPGLGRAAEWRLDLGAAVFPRPKLDPGDDEDRWPPAWRDDIVDTVPARMLWEEGGVARKP